MLLRPAFRRSDGALSDGGTDRVEYVFNGRVYNSFVVAVARTVGILAHLREALEEEALPLRGRIVEGVLEALELGRPVLSDLGVLRSREDFIQLLGAEPGGAKLW